MLIYPCVALHLVHKQTAMELVTLLLMVWMCLSHPSLGSTKPKHPVPTYFYRYHPNGSIVDQNHPDTRLKFLDNAREIPTTLSQPSASLKVFPSLIDNAELVNVSWNGVSFPTEIDYIALYCPTDDKPNRYLDYVEVKNYPTYLMGYGSFQVRLYNMRTDCQFRYYRSGASLITVSNVVKFKGGPEAPLQGHISLTGDPTQMRIMWVSGADVEPVVYYTLEKDGPLMKKTGTFKTYKASDMCDSLANSTGFRDPGFIHDVLLTDLKPFTVYYYQYGSNLGMSKLTKFRTPPIPNADEAFKFIVYGDMGVSPPPRATTTAQYCINEVEKNNATFVVHMGDISYAMGHAYLWEQWPDLIQPYATRVPYMVGIGNHEYDHERGGEKDPSGARGQGFHPWFATGLYHSDSGGECGVPMFNRFHMPENGHSLWWYSFDYGSVHIIMMSTEHDFLPTSEQYKWIENDLRNVNRSITPWVMITGHRPMYSSQKYIWDYMLSRGMQHFMEEMLHKYKVDLGLWAHYHSYERTCPVYKSKCTENSTIHIVVGTAGKEFDSNPYMDMDWSVYREIEWGYGRITVNGKKSLLWEWIRNKDNVVADKVLLTKY